MNSKLYSRLAVIAVFSVPLAPAVFLGLRLFSQGRTESADLMASDSAGWVLLLLALAAGMTAVGLELVGIISGHVTAKLFQRRDRRWVLSALALLIYTGLGFLALRGTVGAITFLIAPLVYFVTAISAAADEQHQEDQRIAALATEREGQRQEQQEAFERQQIAEQAAFRRELALRQAEAEANQRLREAEIRSQERLARARAKARATAETAPPAPSRAVAAQSRQAEPTEPLTCPGCGYEAGNLNALKGHKRWCQGYVAWKERVVQPVPAQNGNGRY